MSTINQLQLLTSLFIASALMIVNVRASSFGSDNFTESSGTNVSVVTDTESLGVGTYQTILFTNAMTVTNVSGFGSGNVLSLPNGTAAYYRVFNGGSTLTLANMTTGQALNLSFVIRCAGSFGGADNFSFGFVGTAPASNSIVYANLDLSASGGLASEFRYRAGSYNMSDVGLSIGSSFTEPVTVSSSNYTMQLTVTKETNGYSLAYFRDSILTGTNASTSSSAFAIAMTNATITGIAFRHAQTPSVITYIDNVSVTLTESGLGGANGYGSTNTTISLISGDIQFGFEITSDAVYRIQSGSNLLDGAGWTDMAGPLTNLSGSSITFTDPETDLHLSRSYRVASP